MPQIFYISDTAAGVRHGTFVLADGHAFLRNIPDDKVEEVKGLIGEWVNTLENAEKATAAQVSEFCEDQGFELIPDFNPPLLAYGYVVATADKDSIHGQSVAELRSLAKDLGVDSTGLKKAELIQAIEAKMNEDKGGGAGGN